MADTETVTAWETVDLPDFNSLPYIVPSWQKSTLQKYKKLAIEKEELIASRKERKLHELREYVRERLNELETKPSTLGAPCISEARNPSTSEKNVKDEGGKQLKCLTERRSEHVSVFKDDKGCTHQDMMSSYINKDALAENVSLQCIPGRPLVSDGSVIPASVDGNWGKHTREKKENQRPLTGKLLERWRCSKLAAIAKGFLVRRLYQSNKVKHLRKTVKDAERVLESLPDFSATVNKEDLQLKARVTAQLLAAKIAVHEIFFELQPYDRMVYIAHTRAAQQERRRRYVRPSTVPVEEKRRKPTGRLSAATLKAIERKKHSPAPNNGTRVHKTSTPHTSSN